MQQKSSENEKIKIGLAQLNPTVGAFELNFKKIKDCIQSAEQQSVDLLVFPELVISGYPVWDLANKESFIQKNEEYLNLIIKESEDKNLVIVCGYVAKGEEQKKKSCNALCVIHKGKVLHQQHKFLLPNYDVFLEQIFFESAKEVQTLSLFGAEWGMSICEDLWEDDYEHKPIRKLKEKGAQFIVNISASPYHQNKGQLREDLIASKAKEYGVYVIYCNQVGAQDELIFDGRSLIADPSGRIIYEGEMFKEGLYVFELDTKAEMPEVKDERGPQITQEMYEALVLGVRDYITKNGFKKVLLGLSGGIDSALTAAIACDAIGAENVLGITMPGPYSSEGSVDDSLALAKNLGMECRVRSIKDQYEFKIKEIVKNKKNEKQEAKEETQISLAMENLQARLRGLELMYTSNDEGRMLLSTGNKSELAMGYCTIYGDMCGGLCVLGDLYKSEVFRLSQYRAGLSPSIPKETIEKPPSAELRPDQKDEDSLPSYELLDQVLYYHLEESKTIQEIRDLIQSKMRLDEIKQIIRKIDHNEYKRRQSAPILRVTQKAWFGRRMPITNRFELEE